MTPRSAESYRCFYKQKGVSVVSKAFSNPTTKHYCPKCGSFNLKRTHRGFIKKKLLKLSPQYECKGCSVVLSETTLSDNEPKAMPQFIT